MNRSTEGMDTVDMRTRGIEVVCMESGEMETGEWKLNAWILEK